MRRTPYQMAPAIASTLSWICLSSRLQSSNAHRRHSFGAASTVAGQIGEGGCTCRVKPCIGRAAGRPAVFFIRAHGCRWESRCRHPPSASLRACVDSDEKMADAQSESTADAHDGLHRSLYRWRSGTAIQKGSIEKCFTDQTELSFFGRAHVDQAHAPPCPRNLARTPDNCPPRGLDTSFISHLTSFFLTSGQGRVDGCVANVTNGWRHRSRATRQPFHSPRNQRSNRTSVT